MGRQARDNRPNLKPVERIELSEKHVKLRFILVIVLILVGVGFLVNGLMKALSSGKGIQTIEVNTAAGLNCGSDFVFRYDLGKDNSATVEARTLTDLYTAMSVKAYKLFSTTEYGEPISLGYINSHPNVRLQIDPVLYKALKLAMDKEDRHIFLGPVMELYSSVFFCETDDEAANYDPFQSSELSEIYEKLAYFAGETSHVNLEFFGDDTILLSVSDEYVKYLEDEKFINILDFGFMKNAFIIDYFADEFAKAGFTRGELVSFDGFIVNLGKFSDNYRVRMFRREGSVIKEEESLELSGANRFVTLRDYPLDEKDREHYYEKADGSILNAYVSLKDGKCNASIHELYAYSDSVSTSEMLLELVPFYVEEKYPIEKISGLKEKGINPYYY